MSVAPAFLHALTTVAALLYFVSLDVFAGGSVIALNATLRGTPRHRALRSRLVRMLPLALLATVALGSAFAMVLRSRGLAVHGPQPAMGGGVVAPPLFHITFASLAIAGLWVAQAALRIRASEPEAGQWLVRHGVVWAVLATVANLFVGSWWLVRLPQETMIRFTGASLPDMVTFSTAIVAALLSLGFVAMSATEREPARYLHAATVAFAVTLAAMVRMRETLRPVAPAGDVEWLTLFGGLVLMAGGVLLLGRAWRAFAGAQN